MPDESAESGDTLKFPTCSSAIFKPAVRRDRGRMARTFKKRRFTHTSIRRVRRTYAVAWTCRLAMIRRTYGKQSVGLRAFATTSDDAVGEGGSAVPTVAPTTAPSSQPVAIGGRGGGVGASLHQTSLAGVAKSGQGRLGGRSTFGTGAAGPVVPSAKKSFAFPDASPRAAPAFGFSTGDVKNVSELQMAGEAAASVDDFEFALVS